MLALSVGDAPATPDQVSNVKLALFRSVPGTPGHYGKENLYIEGDKDYYVRTFLFGVFRVRDASELKAREASVILKWLAWDGVSPLIDTPESAGVVSDGSLTELHGLIREGLQRVGDPRYLEFVAYSQ